MTAALLLLPWARFLAGVRGDLAAQWAWADFAARHPDSAYNLGWYGGMHPVSYSVLAPYLMAVLGVRTVAVLAGTGSAALLGVLVRRSGVRWPLPVALCGAVALSCNVAAGRVTFALGTMFALAALVAAGRPAFVAALSLLATLSSPVAGLFVEVAAAAWLLGGRRREGWALAVPPLAVVLVTSLLFPFYGVEPMSARTALICGTCTAAVAVLSPARWRTVRTGAAVYALGTALTWALPTPVGSNVQRLALIFGPVLLLAALCDRPAPSRRRAALLLVALAATAYWTVKANLVGLPAPTPTAQATALTAELGRRHAQAGRVEVVPILNHWEAWALAPSADLARGWNRQLDVRRNPLFYDGTFSQAGYREWLRRWAVGYVVLPEGPLEPGAAAEASLVRSHPAWLEEVWHDAHWRLYRFTDALPLTDPPTPVDHADAAGITLTVPTPGPLLVRVPWSPWLSAHGPTGTCLTRIGDWTQLTAPAPGTYRLDAPYTWPRGTPC